MKFYKIENPTTKQIFDAIISNEYTPIEKVQPKAKQIKVLLLNYYSANELFVTFTCVTNAGAFPKYITEDDSLYEIASEEGGFYDLSEEEKEESIELLGCYLQTYDSIFNL
jgi:hypothetical protein